MRATIKKNKIICVSHPAPSSLLTSTVSYELWIYYKQASAKQPTAHKTPSFSPQIFQTGAAGVAYLLLRFKCKQWYTVRNILILLTTNYYYECDLLRMIFCYWHEHLPVFLRRFFADSKNLEFQPRINNYWPLLSEAFALQCWRPMSCAIEATSALEGSLTETCVDTCHVLVYTNSRYKYIRGCKFVC